MPTGHVKTSSFGGGASLTHQRSSPFRRPDPTASASPAASLRQTTPTPTASPTKVEQPSSPSLPRPASSITTSSIRSASPSNSTPRAQTTRQFPRDDMPESPVRQHTPLASSLPVATVAPAVPVAEPIGYGSALSQLQPAQVRSLREGFQILDRDSDGSVNKDDVADMLNQLGLPSTASEVSRFFPPSGPQTIPLATFLNSIATSLASLSPSAELLTAFSAFDNDDSGQVDLAELRDALLHTAPEPGERALTPAEIDQVLSGFSGKKAFGGKMKGSGAGGFGKRAEVFRYQEFVASLAGGNSGNAPQGEADEETEE
ncbi:hypothetical protein BD289DRAFT_480671 [Coniella lustricola]|uniref:EF-hand domain-containing protein n=1 Tax=Coniella lustricola TaxID=2025994 RepID=A0A2T3AEM4_9PEZI|nr:hypothetical protein BD289DRAFT_480671 [Coniella lustricola]